MCEAELNENVMVLKDQMMTGALMLPPFPAFFFFHSLVGSVRTLLSLGRGFNGAVA